MIPDAQTADQPAPDAEDEEPELDLAAFDDAERPRRVSPTLKKAIAYKRDRRFVAEYPHSSRKAWPRIKALRGQIDRRRFDRALRRALSEAPSESETFTPLRPGPARSRYSPLHENVSLGTWVDRKLEKRLSFVGSNIGAKITYERYWRRLVPFLESLVTGKQGHSVELARRLQSLLDDLSEPGRMERRDRRQLGLINWIPGWYRALRALFAEQPEWEARLRAWIAEVAPEEPTRDEPAWRRIRRHRANRPR